MTDGDEQVRVRLNKEQTMVLVEEAKQLRSEGLSDVDIAKHMGVTETSVLVLWDKEKEYNR